MIHHANYAVLMGLFFLAFVQEDSAVVSSALLGYNGAFPYWLTFAACFLGMWVSDIGIYFIVKIGGKAAFRIALGATFTTGPQDRSSIALV